MIELTYVLSVYPVARETFVTGEIAAVAGLLDRVGVVALTRGTEPTLRPGGIPETVAIDWFPSVRQGRWWRGVARALVSQPAVVGSETREQLRSATRRSRLGDLYRTSRVAAAAGTHLQGADAGHLHAHFATRGAMAARALAKFTGQVYSVTVHAYDLYADNPYLDPVIRDASLIVAISEDGRDAIVNRFPAAAERVEVIHVGVPTDRLRPAGLAPAMRPQDDTVRLVSAGRLVEKKGFAVLLDALAMVRERRPAITLDLIGDGPLRADVEARIERLGLQDRVRLSGELPPETTRERIGNADVFVLACVEGRDGDRDGIPVVLMEAMSMGVPVISTAISGVPELIDHGRTGRLAPPGDAAGLAREIVSTLALSPATRSAQVGAARKTVVTAFDQRRNAERLVARIADAHRRQPRTMPTSERR